jgi:hypothetical protein
VDVFLTALFFFLLLNLLALAPDWRVLWRKWRSRWKPPR